MNYLSRQKFHILQVQEYINDLLYSSDCVIIPGLGGFVANTRNAFLNPAQHTFSPPAKRIAFNAGLRTNDGLLAHHISNVSQLSYSEAVLQIQSFVDNAFDILNDGQAFKIDKVGTLNYNAEKQLQFEPDNSVNYLTASFGLTTIHSPAIRREESGGAVRNIKTSKAVKHTVKKSFWRLLELVPAAAVLFILAFSPSVIKNLNASLSSIVPVGSSSSSTIADETGLIATPSSEKYPETKFADPPPTDTASSAIETSDSAPELSSGKMKGYVASINLKADENDKSESEAVEPAPPISTKVVMGSKAVVDNKITSGNYYVIGGCFKIYENAVKFKEEAFSQGFDSEIIGTNAAGLTMVSLFSSNSSSESYKQMAEIKNEFQEDAWMFKGMN